MKVRSKRRQRNVKKTRRRKYRGGYDVLTKGDTFQLGSLENELEKKDPNPFHIKTILEYFVTQNNQAAWEKCLSVFKKITLNSNTTRNTRISASNILEKEEKEEEAEGGEVSRRNLKALINMMNEGT